jgi:hypothetical protein
MSSIHEGLAMRKVFLSAAALTGGLMLHGAFACELNREASQPAWAIIVAGACSGSNCFMSPAQESLTGLATEKRSPVDPAQNCAVYFDPGTYSGSDGLLDWLVASLGAQSQYKPAAGFAPSPMDANAQYR